MHAELVELLRSRSVAIGAAMDREGTGRIPSDAGREEQRFLSRAFRLLSRQMNSGAVRKECKDWVSQMERAPRRRLRMSEAERARWKARSGLEGDAPLGVNSLFCHNVYAFLQTLAADPSRWRDVAAGMLHSAVQVSLAKHLETVANMDERGFTETFLEALVREIWELFAAANSYADSLPPDCFMHFFTANMQGKRDELDSDLAFVVGVLEEGEPIYRVCVLQAKWRPRHGGRLEEGEGRQLARLAACGMGHYLFYPNPNPSHYDTFRFASVVPAGAVLMDVWGDGSGPSYLNADTLDPDTGAAWDLPTFVSSLLGPGGAGHCRTFRSEDEVREVLQGEREAPLARKAIFVDTTEGLLIAKLEGRYAPEARTRTRILGTPPQGPDRRHRRVVESSSSIGFGTRKGI